MGAIYDPVFESAAINASLPVNDSGVGAEQIANLLVTLTVADVGTGLESIGLTVSFVVLDDGHGNESILLTANIPVFDTGLGTDTVLPVSANINVADVGQGNDIPVVAKIFFFIDANNVLHPLGVIVLRGESREDLIPGTQDHAEELPGRHGELDFGSEFRPRVLELRVAQSTDPSTREQLKRTLAKWLNPLKGSQALVFADDIEKTYYVKYAGKIDLSQWPDFMEFTIPFKAGDPFIIGSFEKTHVGSGILANEGTFETPVVITIQGPVTNPSVQIGSSVLSYTGALAGGDALVIDTEAMTVKFNGVNALGNYSGGFPKLQPGDTTVVAATGGSTTFTWRDRWI